MKPYVKPSSYVTPFISRRQKKQQYGLEISLLPRDHPEYFDGGRKIVYPPHDRTPEEMLDIASSYRKLRRMYIDIMARKP